MRATSNTKQILQFFSSKLCYFFQLVMSQGDYNTVMCVLNENLSEGQSTVPHPPRKDESTSGECTLKFSYAIVISVLFIMGMGRF